MKRTGTTFLGLFLLLTQLMSQCDFSISNSTACSAEPIVFSVDNPAGTYGWDFDGDVNIDAYGSSVTYTYPQSGTDASYTVTLYDNNVACGTATIIVLASPDPLLGVVPGNAIIEGNLIRVCSTTPEATLQLINLSTTLPIDQTYYLNWGDGIIDTLAAIDFDNNGFIEHDYSDYGYYSLSLSTIANNGCTNIENYIFYNGSNPSVGLANPGNTVGLCAPATIDFPITNYTTNPPGTEYFVYIGGDLIATYTQANVPAIFTYTFLETSCGLTTSTGNYNNAFDVQVEAVNPCGSSQATIEPIEISTPPELNFDTDSPGIGCVADPITISNASTNVNEVVSGNPSTCASSITPSWTISPGVAGIDWDIISGNVFGSDQIEIVFHVPGSYTVTMHINSQSCGAGDYSQTFLILEPPVADGIFELNSGATPNLPEECAITTGTFINQSTGDSLSHTWQVSPAIGWAWANGSIETDDYVDINFLEAGTYSVGLLVENECALEQWDTTFTIAAAPIVTLGPLPIFCESGTLNIDQSDVNYNANGGIFQSFNWSFPGANPNSSTDQYPTGIYYDTPGNYQITLSTINQCGTTTTQTALEVQAPGGLVIDNDITVCQQDHPFTLSANPAGGYWTGNGVDLAGLFTPSAQLIGEYVLTYQAGQGACTLLDSLIVTVLATPTVDAGPSQQACVSDEPFLISGGSPIGGTWTSLNGGVLIGGDTFDPVLSGVGVYTLSYTFINANGCTASDNKTIIVNALPNVEAGPDQTFCENPNDIQLSSYSPLGGVWTGPGVTSDGIFNAANTSGQGSYLLFYDFTDPNTGCYQYDSLQITVAANETAYANVDTSACINSAIMSLEDGQPMGGLWSGTGVSNGNLFDPAIAGEGAHVLTYTYGIGICETTDTRIITVHPLPLINLPADMEICFSNDAVDLSAASPIGGIWSGVGIVGNDFMPPIAGVGNHELTYTYQNQNTGCQASEILMVQVWGLPDIVVNDSSYCDQAGAVPLPFATPANGNWAGPGMVGQNYFDPAQVGIGIHEFTYSFSDGNGCEVIEAVFIQIFAPIEINAGANDSLCIDQGIVQLSGFSPTGGIWSGAGIVDSLQGIFDPALVGGGSHELTYTYGVGNCQVFDSKILFVIDLTGVGVGGPESFCEFDEVAILAASGPAGGQWSGPGIVNGAEGIFNPSLAGPGMHIVNYEYIDPVLGCTATAEKAITVFAQSPADFSGTTVACENETVAFQNNSDLSDNFLWDFGDGTASISPNPIHIYDSSGTYEVTLISENANGCSDTISKNILITEKPAPSFELSTHFGCAPLEVDFSNQSTGHEVGFSWDFGNGLISDTIHPDPVVYTAGLNDTTYYIQLAVSNLCGVQIIEDSVIVRALPEAAFAFVPEGPCSPMTVNFGNVSTGSVENFYWDFSNGNFSSDTFPQPQIFVTDTTVAYYDVSLIASNSCGVDTAIQTITVTPPDVRAFFTASNQVGCEDFTVDFTNFATAGANVDWDFGDGNSTIELNPSHTFEDAGTYTVIQYATSECGYDTMAMQIDVLPAPQVSFEHATYVCLGQQISFSNTSENTFGNEWDFGDSTGSTLTSPMHVYTEPGTYTVSLIGYSQFNQCPNTYTSEVIVQGLPMADFEPTGSYGCAPFNASFSNASENAEFYTWDFGDGNTSIEANPAHLYTTVGTFEVSLIATDAFGCSQDTSIINILVNPSPTALFEYDAAAQCTLPANFLFQNLSEGAAGFSWNFGDGQTSAGNQPAHSYLEEGEYDISLIATNQFGCADTSAQTIQVLANPGSDFDVVDFEGCSPVTATFTNASAFGDSFQWIFGDGQTSQEENPVMEFTQPGYFAAQLIVGSNNVCYDTVTVNSLIQVYPEVIADFIATPVEGDQSIGTYEITNTSIGADSYFWDFSDGSTSDEISPTHRFYNNSVHSIYLEASNEFGCVDDTLVHFTPSFIKGLHIPSGFSPEQGLEGIRVFKPAGIGLKEYRIQVYSPYGQLLWESTELSEAGEPVAAWDGRFEGQLLQQDVYVWKAYGMFEDGTVWVGEKNEKGRLQTIGSVILLR